MAKLRPPVQTTITGLSADGFGIATHNGRPLLVPGAVPGEELLVRITKRRRSKYTGVGEQVITGSPHRVEPVEDHYLSCSPFQCFHSDYQHNLKQEMLQKAFSGIVPLSDPVIHTPEERIGYRTKIEYSFWNTEDGLQLAFHERGSPFRKIPVMDGCMLASTNMNSIACVVRDLLRKHEIPKHVLSTLTIRESKSQGSCLAQLQVVSNEVKVPISLTDLPEWCAGWIVTSAPERGVSNAQPQVLVQEGEQTLTETIAGKSISYPYNGFFQNHVPLFVQVLERMRRELPTGGSLVELYSGVGTIGITLADMFSDITAVELVPESVVCARQNAEKNGISKYSVIEDASENAVAPLLENSSTVILDPPRAGLHANVIESLQQSKPPVIAYLSCNPVSQARDIALLQSHYTVRFVEGYDFYPGALHLESLAILDRK